jgi:hypothetical protein
MLENHFIMPIIHTKIIMLHKIGEASKGHTVELVLQLVETLTQEEEEMVVMEELEEEITKNYI